MFESILIANRGEIACRVIRTCARMGIRTVAVRSDADAEARHVREADVAVRIGPAPARESYLDASAIVRAAIDSGAQAIHPGYGFLSEKLELIDACAAAGIAFIGPHRDAIARMGSKIESKRIARAAGVPCVPGYDGDDQSDDALASAASSIGFPLLIKASAGGGGKGMKRVDEASTFLAQLRAARSEARAAFGDDRVLLERCVQRPRHLEVQLLGDRHGNLVHLYERECSIQRNYQKVIEEAPANHLSPAVRDRLFAAALSLGRTIGYDSVGTVEFVLDADGGDEPWFLEMNTRLQVEHPVTEATVTMASMPVDLVERQILSACGERLPVTQAGVAQHGWAIEARINAEIPDEGFAASFGRIARYEEPAVDGVRVDSGIDAGSTVTPHYDSMLAKVIGFGATRAVARDRLRAAVRTLRIEGLRTNQRLLASLLAAAAFDGVLTTRFLADLFPGGSRPSATEAGEAVAAAAAAWYFERTDHGSDRPLDALRGFRLTAPAGRRATSTVVVGDGDANGTVVVENVGLAEVACRVDGHDHRFTGHAGSVVSGDRCYRATCRDGAVELWCAGDWRRWSVLPAVAVTSTAAGDGGDRGDRVLADLPGVVTQVLVAAGQAVTAGMPVVVVEAMKLFHTLLAPRDGVVETIDVTVGATIDRHAVLLALAPLAS